MNELFRQWRADGDPCGTSLSLSRKHYGILLSGRAADAELGVEAIPPIYNTAFNRERNLLSWSKVGAVPFTIQCLQDESVRVEVDETSTP